MTVLLFLPEREEAPPAWLRLGADGAVAARGEGMPPAPGPGEELVAVAPPGAVTLRRLDLPAGLSEPQALAAARLAAAALAAEPDEALHVAVGSPDPADGARMAAIARAELVERWLERLADAGLEPSRLVPAPMLLPAPAPGEAVAHERDGLLWVRRAGVALAAEPDVVQALPGAPPRLLDAAAFEAGLASALSEAAPDLRQGRFAPRARFVPDWPALRRMAALAAGIAVLLAGADLARAWRASVAAEAARAQAVALARPLLPAGARVTDPVAQLRAAGADRVTGAGFGPRAAALFAAVRDAGGATLEGLEVLADGRMRAALSAPAVADLAGVESRLDGLGLEASLGAVRQDRGRQRAELTVER